MCEVGTVGIRSLPTNKEDPGLNARPGRRLNFGRPSFVTLSVDRESYIKPLV